MTARMAYAIAKPRFIVAAAYPAPSAKAPPESHATDQPAPQINPRAT
jgi:hypothetical protein